MEKNIKQMKLKLINNNKINNNFNNNKKFIDASTNYNFFNLPFKSNNNLNSKLNFYYVNKNIIYPINNNNYKLNYREYYNLNNNNDNINFHKISKSNEIRKKFKIKINDSNPDDINKKYTNINSPNHIKRKFRFLSIDYIDKIFNNNSNKNKTNFNNVDINSKINNDYKNSKKKKILSRNNINDIFSNSNENNFSNRNSLTTSNVKIKKINPLKYKTFHLDSKKNIENFKLLKLLINNQKRKNFELIEGIKEEILKNEYLLKTYNVTLFNKNLHILNDYKINKKYDK